MKQIKSKEYYLVKPFKIIEKTNIIRKVPKGQVLLKPLVTGICGSDILYFKGQKDPEKLKKRLPLILLHEGVAQIAGTSRKVIVIPLNPCGRCYACKFGYENLCTDAKFMASTGPGMARSPFLYPQKLTISLPANIAPEIGALTEPIGIGYRAVLESGIKTTGKVAVIGDGPVAYFTALMISYQGKIPKSRLYVLGIVSEKLKLFSKFSKTVNTMTVRGKGEFNKLVGEIDYVFEAAGGSAMEITVAQALELLKPRGTLTLVGLSDKKIPVKIIDIVNKGLIIKGSSRCKISDYKKIISFMRDRKFQYLVKNIINPRKFYMKSRRDLIDAFNFAGDNSNSGRTLIFW